MCRHVARGRKQPERVAYGGLHRDSVAFFFCGSANVLFFPGTESACIDHGGIVRRIRLHESRKGTGDNVSRVSVYAAAHYGPSLATPYRYCMCTKTSVLCRLDSAR